MSRVAALVLLASLPAFLGGEAHRRTEKGNALYGKGRNDAALEEYGKAQSVAPAAPELPYDIGNVLYRQKNYAGAAEAYEKALAAAPPALAPRVAYNLGNALYSDTRYADAVKAYVQALRGAPHDADAKRNLELALRALEEQKRKPQPSSAPQPQPRQQPRQQPGQDQQGGPGKDETKSGGAGRSPQSGGEETSQGNGGDKGRPGEDRSTGSPARMSAEEAKRLLDRVAALEGESGKAHRSRTAGPGDVKREKDW